MDYITIYQWLAVKKETRQKLIHIFHIPSTGMVEVVTDEYGVSHIKQDGYTNADLRAITVEKLVDYLGTAAINETIFDLWKQAVEKAEIPEEQSTTLIPETITKASESLITLMNTADKPLMCDLCPFRSGSAHGIKIHRKRHNRIKTA